MSLPTYAEDIFLAFYRQVVQNKFTIQTQDFQPITSFYEIIITDKEFTQNQANFLVKILIKYKNISALTGLDYKDSLQDLHWKKAFRILDLSKKIYVEINNNEIEICVKFPYTLKKEFENEVIFNDNASKLNTWDNVNKIRRINVYDVNIMSLYDFVIKHSFEIDESFHSVLAEIEEIWQHGEEIGPHSLIENSLVVLKNAASSALEYWHTKKTGEVSKDLLIAKTMGFIYRKLPNTIIEKIAASKENTFWITDYRNFFDLVQNFDGKVCVVLDRAGSILPWLQNFVKQADNFGFIRDHIKVCFRENKENLTGLNEWIKLAGVGGKVDSGKILIFESKPAKWLLKADVNVTMMVTNNIYPPTNMITKDWFQCHPCVVYLGTTKPTEQKGHQIVEL